MNENLYYLLETSTKILADIKYKTCCKDIRNNALSFALKDLYEDLHLEYDINTMNKDPNIYYVYLRDQYLPYTTSLSPVQKIKLIKNLNNMK